MAAKKMPTRPRPLNGGAYLSHLILTNCMNVLKTAALSAALFFSLAGAVALTGCEADPCLDLRCQNSGSCAEGFCRCPTGYEGAECEIRTADRFVGTFLGTTTCDGFPILQDSVTIFFTNAPVEVGIVRYSDSVAGRRDTLFGTVVGSRINIPDVVSGAYRRFAHATISDKNMTYYEETIGDVNIPASKEVCNFIGTKISVP